MKPAVLAKDGNSVIASTWPGFSFRKAIEFVHQGEAAQADGLSLASCMIAPGEKTRESMALQLQAAGFRCAAIAAQSNHAGVQGGVIPLATLHRAEGLEFDCAVAVTPKFYRREAEEAGAQRKHRYIALTNGHPEDEKLQEAPASDGWERWGLVCPWLPVVVQVARDSVKGDGRAPTIRRWNLFHADTIDERVYCAPV